MQVQELFPHLSADFITRCLAAFDNSADRTINALLENNLPPGLDANAPSASAAAAVSTPPAVPPPAERRNVYDTQQPAEVRLGKKDKHTEDSESARKDREHLKEFVRNYEWTYDDEADDSLDAFGVGVSDRTADEALAAAKARAARVGAKKVRPHSIYSFNITAGRRGGRGGRGRR